MKKVSTSALAKTLEIPSKDLFNTLLENGLIERKDEKWILTETGRKAGGETYNHSKYGEYITWPENFNPLENKDSNQENKSSAGKFVNATAVGKEFNLSSVRMNMIFAELGWTEKAIKGWAITKFGKSVGGIQKEHKSGGSYVLWPETILKNKALIRSINDKDSNEDSATQANNKVTQDPDDFRTKFPANMRTKDGHQVRSRAEVIIDNALYDYGLAHAYERKLPIEEDVYSDFYIPSKNGGKAVYIEFWGLENDPKYAKRKEIKKDIYARYDLNLIELSDKEIQNLDDHLPRMLLKFDIRVE